MSGGLLICTWVGGNSLLAIIPVVLAHWLARGIQSDIDTAACVRWKIWVPMLLLWLLFLPNGAYLLTEWRHYLSIIGSSPAFYSVYHDQQYSPIVTVKLLGLTALFGLYSLFGLVATGCAIWPLERLAARYFRTGPLLSALFVVNALGVYMGLVDRLNSWELTRSTLLGVIESIWRVATHPDLLIVIVLFAAFLRGIYAAFTIFARGLQAGPPPARAALPLPMREGSEATRSWCATLPKQEEKARRLIFTHILPYPPVSGGRGPLAGRWASPGGRGPGRSTGKVGSAVGEPRRSVQRRA